MKVIARAPPKGAITQHHETLRLSLELVGLYDRFDERVFSAENFVQGKPAPNPFFIRPLYWCRTRYRPALTAAALAAVAALVAEHENRIVGRSTNVIGGPRRKTYPYGPDIWV
jgi:hypothetical protein